MVAAAVLLLTGCNADPTPVVTETPSVSPTPVVSLTHSPTPTPIPSTDPLLDALPEGAESPGVAGALMTATFFLEQYGPMIRTGDTSHWDALSTSECGYCADASGAARDGVAGGRTVEGGDIAVETSSWRGALDSETTALIGMLATQTPVTVTEPGSTAEVVNPGVTHGVVFQMKHDGEVWRVNGVQIVDPSELPQ